MSNVAAKTLKVESKVSFVQPNGDTLDPNNLTCRANTKLEFGDGITEGCVSRAVNMRIPVVLSGTMVLDLSAGTYSDGTNTGNLVDKNGAQVTLTKLKYLKVELVDELAGPTRAHLNPAATNAVQYLGGPISAKGNGAGFAARSGLNGVLEFADPGTGATIDGTHKILSLVNESAAAGHFDICLAGIP